MRAATMPVPMPHFIVKLKSLWNVLKHPYVISRAHAEIGGKRLPLVL
jgi:hypothetical protein